MIFLEIPPLASSVVNLNQTAALAAFVINLALALFVFRSAVGSKLSKAYLFWGGGVAIWNLGAFFVYQAIGQDSALFWDKVLFFGCIIAPIGLFKLAFLISQRPIPVLFMGTIYVLHFFFALSLIGDWFISGVRKLQYGYWGVAGPLFWCYLASYCVLTITPVICLWITQLKLQGLSRTRVRALLLAIVLIWIAGTNDLLPILGINYYPLVHWHFYSFGSVVAVVYVVIIGYSTLQHQLLDVRVALGRAAADLLRLGFLFMIGLCLLLLLAAVQPDKFNYYSFFGFQAVLLASAIMASVLFPRLFGQSGESLERRILGDRFEYHDRIRSFIASMQWYSDTDLLLRDLHELLTKTVRVRSYEIILLDEAARIFTVFRSYPNQPENQMAELKGDSPIFRHFQVNKSEYLTFNIAYATPGGSPLEREARNELRQFTAEFCFPFFFEEEPFGLLLIGEKASSDPYTSTDLSLLVSLSKNLSVMINQIRMKTQILQAQELELLGRMSRGMAHDLNNLLTPIWTFLQLSNETAAHTDLNEDLLPVALRNIKTMRAYIREALFFSENLRPDFQLGRLDVVVGQSVDLVRSKMEKSVDILVSSPGEVLVEMDEILIQRLIANIVSNAVDASRPGSTIHIELIRLVKTEMNRDWLRIRVVDSGEGIRPEDLNRVFTPYFTTKNRGDEERGFGLGLAICRKIVHLHGGNLNIASQVKKGTTLQIDLPSRQVKPPVSIAAL